MKKSYKAIILAACGAVVLLSGCATSSPGALGTEKVGDFPGGLSPQWVKVPPEFTSNAWWNLGSFTEVPEDKVAAGDAFCNSANPDKAEFKAIGFHPFARGSDGYPIKGGGFVCQAVASK